MSTEVEKNQKIIKKLNSLTVRDGEKLLCKISKGEYESLKNYKNEHKISTPHLDDIFDMMGFLYICEL